MLEIYFSAQYLRFRLQEERLFNDIAVSSKYCDCFSNFLINDFFSLYSSEASSCFWLMQEEKTWGPQRRLETKIPVGALSLSLSTPNKSNLHHYCGEIVSLNLLINCRIVLQRKRLASAASLQRSHLQPVRVLARSAKQFASVLAEKDRRR